MVHNLWEESIKEDSFVCWAPPLFLIWCNFDWGCFKKFSRLFFVFQKLIHFHISSIHPFEKISSFSDRKWIKKIEIWLFKFKSLSSCPCFVSVSFLSVSTVLFSCLAVCTMYVCVYHFVQCVSSSSRMKKREKVNNKSIRRRVQFVYFKSSTRTLSSS